MTPAQDYLTDLYYLASKTSKYPLNPKDNDELILYDKCATEMEIIPGLPDWVHFISIRALKPGRGWGTLGLKAITNYADKHQVVLFGKAAPFDTEAMPPEVLKKWYDKYKGVMITDALCARLLPNTDVNDIKRIDPITMEKIKRGYNSWEYRRSKKSPLARTLGDITEFVKKYF